METMNCILCGKPIVKKGKQQKYCIKCGNLVNKERTRLNYHKRTRKKTDTTELPN